MAAYRFNPKAIQMVRKLKSARLGSRTHGALHKVKTHCLCGYSRSRVLPNIILAQRRAFGLCEEAA